MFSQSLHLKILWIIFSDFLSFRRSPSIIVSISHIHIFIRKEGTNSDELTTKSMTSISSFYMVVNLTKMVSFVLTTAEGGLQDGPTDSRGSMVRPRCWLLPPQGNYWGQAHFLSIFSFTLKLFQTRRRIILDRYWVFQGEKLEKLFIPKL